MTDWREEFCRLFTAAPWTQCSPPPDDMRELYRAAVREMMAEAELDYAKTWLADRWPLVVLGEAV